MLLENMALGHRQMNPWAVVILEKRVIPTAGCRDGSWWEQNTKCLGSTAWKKKVGLLRERKLRGSWSEEGEVLRSRNCWKTLGEGVMQKKLMLRERFAMVESSESRWAVDDWKNGIFSAALLVYVAEDKYSTYKSSLW